MDKIARVFQDTVAKPGPVPLLIGLSGPSNSGKTVSMLELTHGFQDVIGGDIGIIDTEAKRSLHYVGTPCFGNPKRVYSFRHIDFNPPFGSLDYLAAIKHYADQGVKIIGIDSASHEHEGEGGLLESFESELNRLTKGDASRRDSYKMLAWQKPKADRRRLINYILQQELLIVFCFRAKDKIKPVAGGKPEELGWVPISGEEIVYEMALNLLLPPASDGVPMRESTNETEKRLIKIPRQFREIIRPGAPLSIAVGQQLAMWAQGNAPTKPAATQAPQQPTKIDSKDDVPDEFELALKSTIDKVSPIVGSMDQPKWSKSQKQDLGLPELFKLAGESKDLQVLAVIESRVMAASSFVNTPAWVDATAKIISFGLDSAAINEWAADKKPNDEKQLDIF